MFGEPKRSRSGLMYTSTHISPKMLEIEAHRVGFPWTTDENDLLAFASSNKTRPPAILEKRIISLEWVI